MKMQGKYLYDVTLYFRDGPQPMEINGVCHIGTEGGLLRLIQFGGETQWWPLCNVFNIRQRSRSSAPLA